MAEIITASLMCADLMNLQDEILLLKKHNINTLHIDYMDGKFVPNITFGTDFVKAFKHAHKDVIRDIHLLAYEPQQLFDRMDIGQGDIVSVHYEACEDVRAVLKEISARGAKPSLALSPTTETNVLVDYLDCIDFVLVMTVYPGFAGRPLAPHSFERIKAIKDMIDNSAYPQIKMCVDGNVSWQHLPKMKEMGADMYVAGSSSLYDKKQSVERNIEKFINIAKSEIFVC